MMGAGAAIEIVRDVDEWKSLVPEWLQLWEADAESLPFQRPEWLLPWWEQFGPADGLRVVTIRQHGSLLALLHFYVYREPSTGERQLLPIGAGTTDYLDGVFSAGCTPELVLGGLARLCADGSWDTAHLFQLPVHSRLRAALQRVLEGVQTGAVRQYETDPCSRRSAVPVRELPRTVRADLRFHSNAARGLGPLRLTVAEESAVSASFDELVRLHTVRWEQAGEAGVLADPAVLRWHWAALPGLARAGLLRMVSLHAGPHLLAVLYSLIDPPTRVERAQYFYLIGHSVEHSRLRPGMLLTGLATEQAAGEGVRWIDMLRGDESYKKFWHVEEKPTYGATFARTAFPGAPPLETA